MNTTGFMSSIKIVLLFMSLPLTKDEWPKWDDDDDNKDKRKDEQ